VRLQSIRLRPHGFLWKVYSDDSKRQNLRDCIKILYDKSQRNYTTKLEFIGLFSDFMRLKLILCDFLPNLSDKTTIYPNFSRLENHEKCAPECGARRMIIPR